MMARHSHIIGPESAEENGAVRSEVIEEVPETSED